MNIQLRLLTEDEAKQAEYDGVPATLTVRYCGEDRIAVLEVRPAATATAWHAIEVTQ